MWVSTCFWNENTEILHVTAFIQLITKDQDLNCVFVVSQIPPPSISPLSTCSLCLYYDLIMICR